MIWLIIFLSYILSIFVCRYLNYLVRLECAIVRWIWFIPAINGTVIGIFIFEIIAMQCRKTSITNNKFIKWFRGDYWK